MYDLSQLVPMCFLVIRKYYHAINSVLHIQVSCAITQFAADLYVNFVTIVKQWQWQTNLLN